MRLTPADAARLLLAAKLRLAGNPNHMPAGTSQGGQFAPKTVYHGTQELAIESIKKHGLSPFSDAAGADEYARQQGADMSGRPASVYTTQSVDAAFRYARDAAEANDGSTPMVLRIEIPREFWDAHVRSEDQGDAWAFTKTIPPEWIKAVTVVDPSVWALPNWRSLAAEERVVYSVVLVKNDFETLGSASSGNYGHAGGKGGAGNPGGSTKGDGGGSLLDSEATQTQLLAEDLVAQEEDFSLTGTADRAPESFEDLTDSVQNEARDQWMEEQIDSNRGYDDAYQTVRDDAESELRKDDEHLYEGIAQRVATEVNAMDAFEEHTPLLGVLHRQLDPASIMADGVDLDVDALRTVTGLELTLTQKALVANRWERAYDAAIEDELQTTTESDAFQERVSEQQSGSLAYAWGQVGERERMALVNRHDRGIDEGRSDTDFTSASRTLGVNAEGLARATARVAQSFSEGGTVTVGLDNSDELHVNIRSVVDGKTLRMDRIFSRNVDGTLHVHHELFEVPDSAQGRGIATQMLLESARVYERYGVADLSTIANLSVGGYAWASLGLQASSANSFRHTMVSRMISKGIAKDTRDEIEALMTTAGKNAPFALASHPLGEQILLGSNWSAFLTLSGSTGRDYKTRLVSKAGKKKGKA